MSVNFATLAAEFQQEAITLPSSAAPVTLRSLLAGNYKRKNRHILGVKLLVLSADARWGEDAAKCVIPITIAAGFDEPIQGTAILDAFFSSATVTPVTCQLVLYLAGSP